MTAGSITQALRTASSGLLATQSALGTISNNVANANTEGYSRKIVSLETNVLAGVGSGVNISDVGRAVDEQLMRDMREEMMQLNKISSQTTYFQRTQELFGTPGDNTSIAHTISEFTASLESLSVTPERSLEQSEAVRWAVNAVQQLQDMSDTIQDLRKQADNDIHQVVQEIDNHLTEIADLNEKIVRNSVANNDISALEDKRDMALNELSKLIDITYFDRSNGEKSVFTQRGRVLIDQESVGITHNLGASVSPVTTYEEGDFSGIFVGRAVTANDITNDLIGGQLAGLVEMRDDTLPDLQAQLDHLAATLRDTINAVHNRGVAYPGQQSMSGTTAFLDSSQQHISFNTGDTHMIVTDGDGNQVAAGSLTTAMGGAGTWTLDAVATGIQTWLGTNAGGGTVSFVDGKMQIELSNTSYYLNFRDQSGTAAGDARADAGINFYGNGDGTTVTKSHQGFSDFFGLNDFFTEDLGSNIWETKILSKTYTDSGSTLTFHDNTGGTLTNLGSISISGSLAEQATAINNANLGVRATVISEGSGSRLRLTNSSGNNMLVTQNGGSFISNTGLEISDVRVAHTLTVRSDIEAAPGKISRGIMRWDASLGVGGAYYVSSGDNQIASDLANVFNTSQSFNAAGRLSEVTEGIHDYASAILSQNSSLAANNEMDVEIQQSLVDSLTYRNDSQKGVNLDEELSQLIIYEQAYSAAARVISVIQSLFETLENAVR